MIAFNRTHRFLQKKKIGENWKKNNKEYIKSMEMFLDRASNIQDEDLKNNIINNMLTCDEILTNMAEKNFVLIYKTAYKEGKRNNFFKKVHTNKNKKNINKVV